MVYYCLHLFQRNEALILFARIERFMEKIGEYSNPCNMYLDPPLPSFEYCLQIIYSLNKTPTWQYSQDGGTGSVRMKFDFWLSFSPPKSSVRSPDALILYLYTPLHFINKSPWFAPLQKWNEQAVFGLQTSS